MIKNVAEYEIKMENKIGRFQFDNDTPIGVAKEMCINLLKYIEKIEEQAKEKEEKEKTDPSVNEEKEV